MEHGLNIPLVDLQALHRPIRKELNAAVSRVIESCDFILGEEVERFEGGFAAYCGARYGVGVDSGLSALELTLQALGIGSGDEVIVPALSFISTAAAVSFTGAEPVFVDVNPATFCIDVQHAEAAITSRTRAIIAVHLYGLPANMAALLRIASRYGLKVIEDAAQAHGANYKGRRAGSLGHAAAFSFYPTKNLGALGDGGMVVTDDPRIADRVRSMRICGQKRNNHHDMPPYGRRLDSIQAAVLRVKLRYLDRWNEARRSVAELYDGLLEGNALVLPVNAADRKHVYHQYVVRSSSRDRLRVQLSRQGIGTAVHYLLPIHRQPYYAYKNLQWGSFPVAEQACREVLSLPMHPSISTLHTRFIASQVNESIRDAKPIISANGSGNKTPYAVYDPEFELGKAVGY